MALWVSVHSLADNENLEQSVLNRPLNELTQRTNYLYEQLQNAIGVAFESLRLANVQLYTAEIPAVGDVVYLDAVTKTYRKALAGIDAVDQFVGSPSAYAVGILVAASGSTGTVVLAGKISLSTNSSPWTLANMLEAGEVFRNGSYYLSAVTAGKLTANPSGPAIYIGEFTATTLDPTLGDFAIINIEHKDVADAHQHRAYKISAQPAGTQSVTGILPPDTHSLHGFPVIGTPAGGDHVPRLIVDGSWLGASDVQYTVWLSTAAGTDRPTSPPPTDWSDAYLHWLSSDPVEGQGKVRIFTYELPVALGTKGLVMSLENTLEEDATPLWEEPYDVAADDPSLRTWQLDVPTDVRGWLACRYRQLFTNHPAVDNKYSFLLLWGPHTSVDSRIADSLMLKCMDHYRLAYTGNPLDGEMITIGGTVFEMDNNGVVVAGHVAVAIATDMNVTYTNLVETVLGQPLVNIDMVRDTTNKRILIGTDATVTTAGLTNAVLGAKLPAAGALTPAGSGYLFVYDQNHVSLSPDAATSAWANPAYWVPIELLNGLWILPVPYDATGVAAVADTFVALDYWQTTIADEVPGTVFRYSMGIHQALNAVYPPLPRGSVSLVENGVELLNEALFPPPAAEYGLGNSTFYWYSNLYNQVPWPIDWVSVTNPGTMALNMVIYLTRLAMGESGLVTSLQPAPNSPIRVVRCGTNDPAKVGDLALDLDLGLVDDPANVPGFQVYKQLVGQKLRKGPVVEKLVAGPGIALMTQAGAPTGQGTVTISTSTNLYGGDFEEVALENAKQQMIGMFPYIRLLEWNSGTNIPTAFTAKFRIPHTLDGEYKVIVYATVFGETTIPWVGGGSKQFAGIEFTYGILPDYFRPGAGTTYVFPDNPEWGNLRTQVLAITRTVEIPLGMYDPTHPGGLNIYDAFDPMLVHNNNAEPGGDEDRKVIQALGDPFPMDAELPIYNKVSKGDLIAIRVARTASTSSPEYTGKLGFINLRWQLVAA